MNSEVAFKVDGQRIRPENSEVHRLWCDNSKIKKLTGFLPEISIEEGLMKTINWFTEPENIKKYKVDLYNV
jgi:nucleoside-diphosphate-sugar epimerase